jgi:CRISPR-associated protein Csd2
VTTEEDARVVVAENGQGKGGKLGTMADKYTVPYALYRAHGFFNPLFAAKTGVTREDMAVMWDALEWGWEYTRSAARPEMATRGLYVFSHDSVLGRAHAHELFGRIKVVLRPGVEHPRSFSDYEVVINDVDLPKGVTLTRLVPREE